MYITVIDVEQLATRKTQEPARVEMSTTMKATLLTSITRLSATELHDAIYDDNPHSDTGYQGWLVGRVYNALKRCASTNAIEPAPTHEQLIYCVTDIISRYVTMPWNKTRAGKGRKAATKNHACGQCAECVERLQDIDRDLTPDADSCLHPITISYSDKAAKPLPVDVETWTSGLIDQCYHSAYLRSRAWLASDERPAAIKYLAEYRHVDKVQSLRPLDIAARIQVDNDAAPEMALLADALLGGIINTQDMEIGEARFKSYAPEFKKDGTKCHDNGEPCIEKTGYKTIAKLFNIEWRQVEATCKRLEAIGNGLTVKDLRQIRSQQAPVNPLPAKQRYLPAPAPEPTTEQLEWKAAVEGWKQSQRPPAPAAKEPTPHWQQLGMVDPELLKEQMAQKQRQLDSWLTQLQDV